MKWTVIEAEGYAVGTMCVLGKKLKYFFSKQLTFIKAIIPFVIILHTFRVVRTPGGNVNV